MRRSRLKIFFSIATCMVFVLTADTAFCSDPGMRLETTVSGRVTSAKGGPVSAIVFLEKGRLYGKNFRFGGLTDEAGRFIIAVDGPGGYGIHIYATDHIYFPLSIEVKDRRDNYFEFSLPPNPAVKKAPVISNVMFTEKGNTTVISLQAADPNHNLSHQVLALDAATGKAYRMKPPRMVLPWTKTYPDGKYSLEIRNPEDSVKPENWYFVAADNRCYNSPIMKHPFGPEDFVKARAVSYGGAINRSGKGEAKVLGADIFKNNCGICHYQDSTKTKVGPGLKGLFSRKTTPVQKLPVNEETIRSQIQKGGTDMPPYNYLSDTEVDALIKYLQSL